MKRLLCVFLLLSAIPVQAQTFRPLLGDVNQDGKVNALDLSLLGNILVGNTTAAIPRINLDQPTLNIVSSSASYLVTVQGVNQRGSKEGAGSFDL